MKGERKSVKVNWESIQIVEMESKYTCPTCRKTFVGTVRLYTLAFICDCGQELEVTV